MPSEFPLGLVEGRDHNLYFTERSVDKVARLDPRTGLFTEWTLPTGAFPNCLAVTPDGAVWFTALFGGFLGRIKDGELQMYPIAGGPVGLTYYRGRLWTSLFTGGGLAEISLHGTVLRTWTIPDHPLQVAGSDGRLWLTGRVSVWSVDPKLPLIERDSGADARAPAPPRFAVVLSAATLTVSGSAAMTSGPPEPFSAQLIKTHSNRFAQTAPGHAKDISRRESASWRSRPSPKRCGETCVRPTVVMHRDRPQALRP